ncbi:MAG: hypothetical protein C4308_05600 [Chitinophagaceae bacterium]
MQKIVFPIFILLLVFISCHSPKKTVQTTDMPTKTDSLQQPAQPVKDLLLVKLMQSSPQYFEKILADPNQYRVQIIYTEIDRGKNGIPKFTDHFFNVSDQYFYPASTVKFPVVLLALQKINELNIAGLDKNTTMITEAAYSGQTAVYNDPQAADGRPTIANYIKKILLVSDNDAFNRLYEFLGQEYINNTLHKMGYDSVQIIHRLDIFLTEVENRYTNPVKFLDTANHVMYEKPLQKSQLPYATRNDRLGVGYYSDGKLVNKPFVFSKKNRLGLADLHSMLKSVFFPEKVEKKKRFNLTKDDYRFVQKYMSMFPAESKFPSYDSTYQDAYSKFLLWGETKEKLNGDVRIFHKSGDAYGFYTDVAYVVDFKNNIEFMLSATILANSDGIFNDDHYDYETVAMPFLKNLGEVIYQYELQRSRKHKPDLSLLKFNYSQ